MQELKILTVVFFVSVAGAVISFGGGVYTLVKEQKVREEKTIPASQVAVPALAN